MSGELDLIYCERCDMSINLAIDGAPICSGCGLNNSQQVDCESVEWCDHCGGNGVLDGEPCSYCGGNGLRRVHDGGDAQ